MSVAEQIDSYIRAQLLKIRIGAQIQLLDGTPYVFRTDAGRLVDRQLEYTEHPDDMPGIVYYTGRATSTTEGAELGTETHIQEISIEGFIASGKAGAEGDNLKTDITAAIKADPWFGGLIMGLSAFESDVAVQVGDSVFCVAKVAFSVSYSAPYGAE